jgi:hypothetical protein
LTESIAFFKNYDRLHNPAQDADMEAYVYSKELWDDIDLREDPSHQAPMACQCRNPFCYKHGTRDKNLNNEWASTEQKSSRPDKPAVTSNSTGHSQERQKLAVLENKSPEAVRVCGAPQNSTLWHNRRAGTSDNIRQSAEAPPPECSEPSCPLNRAPYSIKHSRGPYMWNGYSVSLILAEPLSYNLISMIDEFGGSIPPWKIWLAYHRMMERKADECDQQVVMGFFQHHSTAEAWDTLVRKLARLDNLRQCV